MVDWQVPSSHTSCALLQGSTLLAESREISEHQKKDLSYKCDPHLLPAICTLRKGMQALCGASSQELPAGSNMQWEEALTYIFARYTHGSPLLHLAGLHHNTHHYWVTRVENELGEYFQLAWKHCYMPGR